MLLAPRELLLNCQISRNVAASSSRAQPSSRSWSVSARATNGPMRHRSPMALTALSSCARLGARRAGPDRRAGQVWALPCRVPQAKARVTLPPIFSPAGLSAPACVYSYEVYVGKEDSLFFVFFLVFFLVIFLVFSRVFLLLVLLLLSLLLLRLVLLLPSRLLPLLLLLLLLLARTLQMPDVNTTAGRRGEKEEGETDASCHPNKKLSSHIWADTRTYTY